MAVRPPTSGSLDDRRRALDAGATPAACCAPSRRPARRCARRPRCAAEADARRALADEGRPRAVVVAGMGGVRHRRRRRCAAVGRAALPGAGRRPPQHRLPGWVGAADVVIAVSLLRRSTEETLAARRGGRPPRLPAWSPSARPAPPLQALGRAAAGRRSSRSTRSGRQPRASLWALAVAGRCSPADALGPGQASPRPTSPRPPPGSTPTPSAAAPTPSASSTRPRRWRSTSPARSRSSGAPRRWPRSPRCRFAASSPRTPATRPWPARCPRPATTRSGLLDGVFGAPAPSRRRHLRRPGRRRAEPADPAAAGAAARRRPTPSSAGSVAAERGRRVGATLAERARRRACDVLTAEGGSPLERLASLVAVPDFASVYLGPGARPRPDRRSPADHRAEASVTQRASDRGGVHERRRRHQGDRRGAARQPRHRGHQVRRVRC